MSKNLIFLPVLILSLLLLFSCANPITKLDVEKANSTENVTDASGTDGITSDTTIASTDKTTITDNTNTVTSEITATGSVDKKNKIDIKAISQAFAKAQCVNLKERHKENADNLAFQNALKMYQCFGTGDVEGFLSYLSDNVVWIHQGPHQEAFPYYGKFEGKQGVLMWLYLLTSKAVMTQFDFKYFVAEGNRVTAHVLEHAFMKAAGTYALVENLHSFVFNKEGKLEYAMIISESATAYTCEMERNPSVIYQPKYPLPVYDIEKYRNKNYYENTVEKIIKFYCKDKDRDKQILKYFADDAVFIATGYEGAFPFAGKFEGKAAINNLLNIIDKQNIEYKINAIVTERNKVNVLFEENGFVPATGKSFANSGALALQFDENGKIKVAYYYHDSYSASAAYMK